MTSYSLAHLSDQTLLQGLTTLVVRDRAITAELLAHLAEVDERRLYLPAAYPSMYAYCVGELRLSEEAAFKRIHAARTARRFPGVFATVAEGRLHLSAVVMLAPHLTPDNADELLAAAAGRTKAEIEELLARRVGRPDQPECLEALRVASAPPHDPPVLPAATQHAPGRVEELSRQRTDAVGPEVRYALHITIGRDTRNKLRYARELLGHQVPSGDLAQVLDQALDALIARLEPSKT